MFKPMAHAMGVGGHESRNEVLMKKSVNTLVNSPHAFTSYQQLMAGAMQGLASRGNSGGRGSSARMTGGGVAGASGKAGKQVGGVGLVGGAKSRNFEKLQLKTAIESPKKLLQQ